MTSLKYKCEDCIGEFVPNTEILEFCSGKPILSYIDFKPKREKDIFSFMDNVLKLLLLRENYNLFRSDFLTNVNYFPDH